MSTFLSYKLIMKLLCVVLCLIHACCGNLNVYLNQNEVMRLLGLSAELFYVREGLVNEYALHFTVPVPATMDSLAFSWQSLAGRPLPYSLSVDVSDRNAVPHPAFNISRTGAVPMAAETFSVSLACSGTVAAEVNVTIRVNVTLNRAGDNVTALAFRRKKICLFGVTGGQLGAGLDQRGTSSNAVHVDSLPQSGDPSAGLLYLALGGAAALGAVCSVFGAVYCSRAGAKARPTPPPPPLLHEEKMAEAYGAGGGVAGLGAGGIGARNCTGGTLLMAGAERSREQRLQDKIAEITIQRCRIRLRCVLQEGTFGRVYRGTYAEEQSMISGTAAGSSTYMMPPHSSSSSSSHHQETEVLVKTVAEHASQQQVSLLLQEGLGLYGLRHPHLLTVLGVSIEDCTAPFIVYRQGNHSNLKKALLAHKPHHGASAVAGYGAGFIRRAITTSDLVLMALQLSQALAYMHGEGCLHTDVATRNCVIDEKLNVRLGDRALSRDLFPDDYHCLGDNENRPVKWLSLEALTQRTHSAAADVWAFGVLLWELMTLGQQPYADLDPYEMSAYLRDGYRLAQPINCPDELFAVMAYCWAMSADERPSFAQLQICLQEFYTQLTRYV